MLDWKSVFLLLVPVWWHKQLQCQIFFVFCLVDFSLISKPVQPDVLWDIYEYTDESHIKYLSQDPSGAQRLPEALRFVAAERQNSVCPPFFFKSFYVCLIFYWKITPHLATSLLPNFVCNASFSLPFSSTASFYVMMKLFFLLMLSLPSKSLLFFLCIHFLLFLLFAF